MRHSTDLKCRCFGSYTKYYCRSHRLRICIFIPAFQPQVLLAPGTLQRS